MLSRVADAIYWMNRYVERAENIARFINVNLNLSLDSPIGVVQQWEPLIRTTGDMSSFQEKYGEATAENVIRFLTFDRTYPNSIISCLNAARENARSVREIISSEMWQQINAFYHFVNDAAVADQLDLPTFFSEVKLSSHLFAGIASATMTHSEGWHFGLMGRWLERADKTSRIVDVKYFILLPSVRDVGTTLDQLQWIALLRSTSAYEMYRKQGAHRITPTSVAEFLVLDREFPRSIRYCIRQTERSLHQISGTPEGAWQSSVERCLGKLRSDLDYSTIDDVMESGLHEFLDNLQQRMNEAGVRLSETFFATQPV
jgi:uncharacterized alpha-E superfamily protein